MTKREKECSSARPDQPISRRVDVHRARPTTVDSGSAAQHFVEQLLWIDAYRERVTRIGDKFPDRPRPVTVDPALITTDSESLLNDPDMIRHVLSIRG